MKKRRLPPDDFSKALLAERFAPEPSSMVYPIPRLWPEKTLYARFVIPRIVTPTPAPETAAFLLGPTRTTALSYEDIRQALLAMKVSDR